MSSARFLQEPVVKTLEPHPPVPARRGGAVSIILRFFRRPKAYVRYWGWIVCWHLEWRWVGGDWEWWWWNTMDYPEGLPGVPRHPRAFATVRWIRKWAGRIRGPYSHRSDFTDREMGLLHGGKEWSEKAFDEFLERIERIEGR